MPLTLRPLFSRFAALPLLSDDVAAAPPPPPPPAQRGIMDLRPLGTLRRLPPDVDPLATLPPLLPPADGGMLVPPLDRGMGGRDRLPPPARVWRRWLAGMVFVRATGWMRWVCGRCACYCRQVAGWFGVVVRCCEQFFFWRGFGRWHWAIFVCKSPRISDKSHIYPIRYGTLGLCIIFHSGLGMGRRRERGARYCNEGTNKTVHSHCAHLHKRRRLVSYSLRRSSIAVCSSVKQGRTLSCGF